MPKVLADARANLKNPTENLYRNRYRTASGPGRFFENDVPLRSNKSPTRSCWPNFARPTAP